MKEKKKKKKAELKKIASSKQIKILKFIKNECDVKFKGNTSKEVYDFIDEWYPRALKMVEMEKTIGQLGVTSYRARKTYHGNDVHGEWEELKNNRDTIAYEKFKGDIIRARNPIDTLVDFGISAELENISNTFDTF